MPLTEVTEDCRCRSPNVWDLKTHKAGCPVLKHFDIDGLLKRGVALVINHLDATTP